jgi:hypothetical protein
MVGRQAAKIRCRKCEFLIQIAYRGSSDEFDVTATPPSTVPAAPVPAPRPPKAATGQPVIAPVPPPNVAPRARATGPFTSSFKDEGSASKKPTAAVPGLPGLGSPKSTRGAALLSDAAALPRRPLAPLPPPPVPPVPGAGLGVALAPPTAAPSLSTPPSPSGTGAFQSPTAAVAAQSSQPPASPPRSPSGSTQLGDQFRESVQAGGVSDDLPQDGWFVGVNGVPLGPIPLGDLRELAMAGHIDRRSLVWREGQAEWRPLGKFAGLSRVIDDGAAPTATPRPEPTARAPAPAPAASRANGAAANGHVATGFDVVRAEAGERPSAWGDLDDEDDEDEQPTTVKGRVSVMPSSTGLPVPSAPPPPVAPVGLPQNSANPFGMTSSVLSVPNAMRSGAVPSGNLPSGNLPSGSMPSSSIAPSLAPDNRGPSFAMRNAPEPVAEADLGMIRPSHRGRWYLIVAAIVFAFALGAIVTHLMRSTPTAEKPGKRASTESANLPSAAELRPPEPITRTVAENLPPLTTDGLLAAHAPSETERARAVERPSLGAMVASSSSAAPAPPNASARPTTTSALLAGLGGARAPGPSLGKADERVADAGLDATAIQRTVRRYSPGVRQNCWQRALNARAPGVPASAKVGATITVDASGHVQGVTVSGAPKGYPGLARCIEGNVKGWQFPRAGGQTITNVPFMFVGQ